MLEKRCLKFEFCKADNVREATTSRVFSCREHFLWFGGNMYHCGRAPFNFHLVYTQCLGVKHDRKKPMRCDFQGLQFYQVMSSKFCVIFVVGVLQNDKMEQTN